MSSYGHFGYTGQAWLPEVGLYHYKARAYSPTLGRFMQTDPIGYGDGVNLYGYVGGDPINATDPLGLEGEEIVVTGGRLKKRDAGGNLTARQPSLFLSPFFKQPEQADNNELDALSRSRIEDESACVAQGGIFIPEGLSSNRECQESRNPNLILASAKQPTHQRFIQLTTSSYAHILTQHAFFPFPNTSRLLPQYRNVTSVYQLVGQAITSTTGIVQPGGNVRYTANLGFNVGTDQLDLLTPYFTVVVRPTGRETGDVVTAFPGL